ncbi:ATP-grasp domain-containing protein [Terribacillus sp. 179-K 1B1 HS]|uniref:ATP-grasp domain-containing protein n=1 Tax=Terribacillus sp. 179-K 1B1 HS TaxID=3142388 RepID=UPI0039A373CB
MKGWLIYNRADAKRNAAFIDWFLEESNRLSIDLQLTYTDELQVTLQNGQVYLQTKENAIPDFAIVRTIDPMLTAQLEQAGVACFNNAETSSLANDKIKTHMELAKLDIPMVDMYFQTHTPLSLPPLAFPFVWKSAHGRGGKDVHLVETETQYQELQKLYTDHPIVMQKLAPTSGKDVRVFVIGKKVIAAVLRSSEQDFRANYSLGGNATLYSLNTEELKLVQRIIDHYHFGFVGIDFLFDENGSFLFNEIEDVVGSRTLSSVSDINIVKLYLEYISQFLEGYDCTL